MKTLMRKREICCRKERKVALRGLTLCGGGKCGTSTWSRGPLAGPAESSFSSEYNGDVAPEVSRFQPERTPRVHLDQSYSVISASLTSCVLLRFCKFCSHNSPLFVPNEPFCYILDFCALGFFLPETSQNDRSKEPSLEVNIL